MKGSQRRHQPADEGDRRRGVGSGGRETAGDTHRDEDRQRAREKRDGGRAEPAIGEGREGAQMQGKRAELEDVGPRPAEVRMLLEALNVRRRIGASP